MNKVIRWSLSIAAVIASLVLFSSRTAAQEPPQQPDRVEVGQEAPLFELESLDGEHLNLEGLQGEMPLVLIFFRGTW